MKSFEFHQLKTSQIISITSKKEVDDISIFPRVNYEYSNDLVAFSPKNTAAISSLKEDKLSYYITKRTAPKLIASPGYRGKVSYILRDLISKKGICPYYISKHNSDKKEVFFIRSEFLK